MGADLPTDLAVLLDGPDPATRDRAWAGFLSTYNRLLLKAAGAFGGDYDARMDRYRHLVEALAADDFRRLRAFHVQARSSFPAWLTVVARRLCVDFDRTRHGRGGRARNEPEVAEARRLARRRLATLTGADVDPDLLPGGEPDTEARLGASERHELIERALAALDARDRLLVRLRFDDEMPIQRIAETMRFPTVFHVYRRLRIVLDDLRRRLVREGIDGAGP